MQINFGGKKMMLRGSMMKYVRVFAGVALVLMLLGSLTAAQAQSQAEKNKKIAVAFLTMIFNDHKVEEAFKLYAVPEYKQHNPYAASGAAAAIAFLGPYLKQNPEARTDIKRAIADGDLVAIHNNPKQNAKDRGRAVVDIFRLENGKVVEHWDVVQDVPEKSANDNTMF
jgi:predicted SnoaL-like aldol condensation-catalyzing enzyme